MGQTIYEIIEAIEEFAPLSLQESWDNCGVQVGYDLQKQCSGVVLSLDVTLAAVDMAIANGANMVVCHHPMTIGGIRTFTEEGEVAQIIERAIKNDITIYSAHTSLDSCEGGLNDHLAEVFGLTEVSVLIPSRENPNAGLGRVGTLQKSVSAEELAEMVKSRLGAAAVKFCSSGRPIKRVALCSGSGGSLLGEVKSAGVDAYICSDLKYHNYSEMAFFGISLVDVGHYESEFCAIDIFKNVISKKMTTFAILTCPSNTVQYL